MLPEVDVAAATRSSRSDASRFTARADTLGAVPELQAALQIGDVSVSHVDVFVRAFGRLSVEQRLLLAA